MVGKIISHYKILEELGGGGMGIVYKAQDLKLDRFVALKFLSPELTRDAEAKRRFIHEARAASALEHANICTVFEIDETADRHFFIAMSYCEGESLKHIIEHKTLQINESVDIIYQIARGLEKAHTNGIVHRDIKPANIIVGSDNFARIVDFGLAKLAGQTKLTKEGATVGTVAYMSPEQAKGDKVDGRSDLWSLGVMLYEMLCGKLPFKGDYDQAVIYSILNEKPPPITNLRSDVPLELEQLVNKALNKNPDARYQHAGEMAHDLRRMMNKLVSGNYTNTGTVKAHKKSLWPKLLYASIAFLFIVITIFLIRWIFLETPKKEKASSAEKFVAVLPFESVISTEEDRIFREGILDGIITQIWKIKALKVIDRQSVIQYRETDKRPRDIAKELGVNYILTGSILRVGDSLRISPRLIDSESEHVLWAKSYYENYSDIFAVQNDIAQKITSALKAALSPAEKDLLHQVPTSNTEALEYYQKGNYYWYNFATDETNIKAAEMYQKATQLDPEFALAFAKLAYVSIGLFREWADHTNLRLEIAKAAIDKATALAPDLPEVHLVRGAYYEDIEKKFDKALHEFETAYQYQPNNADILDNLGTFYLRQGNPRKAAEYFIKSYELNPYGLWSGLWVSNCYLRIRDWIEADKWTDIYISNHPDRAEGYVRKWNIVVYGYGNLEDGREIINEGMEHTNSRFVMQRMNLELLSRNYQAALNVLISDSSGNYFLQKANIYKLLGALNKSEQNYRSAKMYYENLITEEPERAAHFSNLGLALAGLGNKTEAIQMGIRATKMLPIKSSHLLFAEDMQLNLAHIYILTGESEEAVNKFEFLLSIPSRLTIWQMKLDPIYDPLRENEIFLKLLAKNNNIRY